MAVVGGGYIGLELGTAFAKLGTQVTVVEAEDRILPAFDVELTRPISKRLTELDVDVLTSTRALRLADDGGGDSSGLVVAGEGGDELVVPADKILVTVGRKPNTAGLGLGGLGLTTDRGAIVIDERGHTSMRRVWAIGDVTGEPMLAHRAMKQGEIVAEAIAGEPSVFDARAIPAIVFTDPEVVVVGEAPDEAERNHGEVVVGRFPLAANGRTMTLDSGTSGVVRVVARASDQLVVGIQAVGPAVAELSAAFGLAMEMGATLEDIAGTIHAHPTVGEAFHEAALTALGQPLHITGPRH